MVEQSLQWVIQQTPIELLFSLTLCCVQPVPDDAGDE